MITKKQIKPADTKECNRKLRNTKILIGACIFMSFIFGWAFGHLDLQTQSLNNVNVSNRSSSSTSVDFALFWQVWDKVIRTYDGGFNVQKMVYGAIEGMVSSLGDPYTVFLTPEDTASFSQELSGSVNGIGAEVGSKDNRVIIVAPIVGSPADKAGLKPNDIILSINGADTNEMSLDEAVSKIRGDIGTTVKLGIQRGETKLEFTIVRAKVDTKSVDYKMLDNDIAYIQITRFDSNTSPQIKSVASEIASKNPKGIVLDLRNNPGGYLDAAIDVSSEFIKSGVIVTEKTTERTATEQKYFASGKGSLANTEIPLVVLVNSGSASASEIVAGAIQDNKRGILMGEKTFGKGSVQTMDVLSDGSSIRITIAHWFTPNGKNIDSEGIAPKIEVVLTEEDIKADNDTQLKQANEYIKSRINN